MRGVSVMTRPFDERISRAMKSVGLVPFGYGGTIGLELGDSPPPLRLMRCFGFIRRFDLARRFLLPAFRFPPPD
jgi:hypothetical protein